MKNKVKAIRLERGLTLEQLADISGLSVSQISKIENAKRGWSVDSLQRLADALNVKVADLIDPSDIWQDVPIFGVIGENGVVKPCENGKGKLRRPARAPMAFGAMLALLATDSLYPRYGKGDVVFCARGLVECADSLGKEALVYLKNGVSMIRFVHPGNEKGKFNLLIHNQAPLLNQSLVSCRPVIYASRAER